MRIIKSLVLVIILCGLLFSQQQKIKILDVNIEGITLSDSMTILINSGLMPGKSVSGEEIQKAVKNLWALKLYSDVKIYIAEQNLNGVVLDIKVKEYPKLVDYRIEGRDKIDKGDVKTNIDLYKGGIYTPYRAYTTVKNIKKLYREEGYLLANISVDTTHITSNKITAIIKIDEGKKVQVKKIRFHGNEILTEKELKKQFDDIKEDRWWRGADFDPKKYEEEKENIISYCQKEGFRDAAITHDSLSYNDDKDELFIDIWVTEGTRYYFGDVEFSGNTIFSNEELQREVLFSTGEIYNLEDFEKTINEKIKAKYYNEGYLFSQIQPVETPIGKDTVDIAFNITEGKIVRINKIRITGNNRTNEKVVRRELTIFPGDIFNQTKIERSMQEVWMLNYFANVVPDVKFIQGNDDFVDLEFAVEEKSTDQANASVGYSANEGPIGNLGFSFTNFSMRHPFGVGDGQRLSFQWYFGK
ncbi:MAG: outer membrane protein assembly factor BamA, partial [Calditrichia bacterium]|nr:outer membrane protein assembly factor BamA [Calditrichia bacterium]